jgi:hypothetical protein
MESKTNKLSFDMENIKYKYSKGGADSLSNKELKLYLVYTLNNKEDYERDPEPIRYIINVDPTQYTHGKTAKQLQKIKMDLATLTHLNYNSTSEHEHNITVLVTSCSLAETAQWKYRLNSELNDIPNINICTISSTTKCNKKGSGTALKDFTNTLCTAKEENLPNILIMCSHTVRLRDCKQLLKSCSRLHIEQNSISNIRKNKKFTYNFIFDEVDKSHNETLACKFIKQVQNEHERDVKQIHFVTATPVKNFWEKLKKLGIMSLENLDKDLPITNTREVLDNQYQSILTQNTKYHNGPDKPLDYIKSVIDKQDQKYIDMNSERKIIFAPGEHYTYTHDEIGEYFRIHFGFWSFVHNGTFKGFIRPDGQRKSLKEYMEIFNIKGELRDVFRHFVTKCPDANLVITGYNTISRGITFNTDGFNFTDMFISNYHGRALNELVQLLGRATGNKKYCGKINIIVPKYTMERAQTFVKNLMNVKNLQPERFYPEDFEEKESVGQMIIIKFVKQEDYKNGNNNNNFIIDVLREYLDKNGDLIKKRGPNIMNKKRDFHYVNGKWQYSIKETKTQSTAERWKPRTYKEIEKQQKWRFKKEGTLAVYAPCYSDDTYSDESLQFWLIIPEKNISNLDEFKSLYHNKIIKFKDNVYSSE